MLKNLKNKIKVILGKFGVEKYSYLNVKSNLVIFFNGIDSMELIGSKLKCKGKIKNRVLNKNSNLIQPPNTYIWGGVEYDMNIEGYYYLVDFHKNISRNFIIFNNNVKSLLSSLSWLHVHGYLDDKYALNTNKMINKLKTKKLSLTCMGICYFAYNILQNYNINSRIVQFSTAEDWNTYNNGHTLLEVKINKQWILFDIDMNRVFKLNNRYMNILDFFDNINFDDIQFEILSTELNIDSQNLSSGSISYHGFADYTYKHIAKWYKRIMQIPIIIEDKKMYVGLKNIGDRDRFVQYISSDQILTEQEFRKKFYGDL